jgi:hypothetical protein
MSAKVEQKRDDLRPFENSSKYFQKPIDFYIPKGVDTMTKWLVIYKKQGEEKTYKFCYVNTQKAIPLALEKLFATERNIETIQIKKVVV